MKMTQSLFSFLACTLSILPQFGYSSFGEGANLTRAFGDNVNIRKEPNTSAELLGKLKIGQWVELTGQSGDTLTLNGVLENWYAIATEDGTAGFVWGGMLSVYEGEVNLIGMGSGILMVGHKSGDNVELKFLQNGVLKKTWKAPLNVSNLTHSWSGEFHDLESWPSSGFSPAMNLISLHIVSCEYGCWDVERFIVWNGKNFLGTTLEADHSSAPGSATVTTLTFPGDSEGKPNYVFIHSVTTTENGYDLPEDQKIPPTIVETHSEFFWTGTSLIEK